MIGKVCISLFPYYDSREKKNKYKQRPCLIIGVADSGDYVVLPVSTISIRRNISEIYDVFFDASVYACFDRNSYVRTHKQTIVNAASINRIVFDLKKEYPERYALILSKVEAFQKDMINKAR